MLCSPRSVDKFYFHPRGSAHSKAFAAQTLPGQGRVPRPGYFEREKVSVWELSDDSCSAFVRTQIVGKTKFFDSLKRAQRYAVLS